jgi:hypothetical protein
MGPSPTVAQDIRGRSCDISTLFRGKMGWSGGGISPNATLGAGIGLNGMFTDVIKSSPLATKVLEYFTVLVDCLEWISIDVSEFLKLGREVFVRKLDLECAKERGLAH